MEPKNPYHGYDMLRVPVPEGGVLSRDPHHKHTQDQIGSQLHVVTCIFNPVRYQSRWSLYRDFAKHITEAGAQLHTIEATLGERSAAIDSAACSYGNYHRVNVDHQSEIWVKENLLNLMVQRLPGNWKYVAFVDADVVFSRPDIVDATLHALQHYHVVQMFGEAVDLGPKYERLDTPRQYSHLRCHVEGRTRATARKDDGSIMGLVGDIKGYHGSCDTDGTAVNQGAFYQHPGFAWGWRREAYEAVGGLMEHCIAGAADWHMAWALLGRVDETLRPGYHPAYKHVCKEWERRAVEHLKLNVGFVDGTLLHHWHGSKRQRGFQTRHSILVDNQFNPHTDLKKTSQGVIRITDTKPVLRDQMRAYFRSRNEDSVDL